MKYVDTQEYVSMLRGLVEDGKEVSMIITGNSMSPFLSDRRDTVYFRQPNRSLRRGDMVFYQRETGQFVMHRIWKVKKDAYYIVGDGQKKIEGPVQKGQIFALVTKVKRNGTWIRPGDFWWEFFEHFWIRVVPLRQVIMKCYRLLTIQK